MRYMNGEELEETLIFQDFATDVLYNVGIQLNCYSSRKYNIEKGESLARIEIKNDKLFEKTGNLYIELYEKQDKNNKVWAKSGILREDNTTFYFIGDYTRAWLFVKKQLKQVVLNKNNNFKMVETATSKGVLLPIEYIRTHSSFPIYEFNFKGE